MTTAGQRHVSVVIPVRDNAPALRRCLESIQRHAGDAVETIVVDNGSTDDSARVAERYGARVLRFRRSWILEWLVGSR